MARIVAKNVSFGIDSAAGACVALSGRFNSVALSWTAETPEVTGFGAVNRERLPDGLQDYEVTLNGFYDAAAANVDATLSGIGPGGSTRFIVGLAGSTSSCVMYTGCVILSNYALNAGVADAATLTMTLTPRSGSLTRGAFG